MKVSQHYDNDDDEEVSWDPERDMEEEPAHMAEAEEVEEEPPIEWRRCMMTMTISLHCRHPRAHRMPSSSWAFQSRQPCRCRVLASQATHHQAIVMWPCLFIFFCFQSELDICALVSAMRLVYNYFGFVNG